MRKRITAAASTVAAVALTGGIALAAGGGGAGTAASGSAGAPASRLDDGAQLLSQATITEQQAIGAAQTAASGPLNEVDLEHRDGRLVFNVDVGRHDVKVDASNGTVVASDQDDHGNPD